MTTESSADAAGLRAQRARAAQWLAPQPVRCDMAWPDLAGVPAWAWADSHGREALALHVGGWRHGHTVRRCINGRTLQALRGVLGELAFEALMAAEPASDAPLLPADWPLWLRDEGRLCLLASVERPRLRLALHRALWPALKEVPPPGLSPAEALALVQLASAHLPPARAAQDGAAP